MLLSLLAVIAVASRATTVSGPTEAEIAHLLAYLDGSGCLFNRNGTWYDAHQARAHLERKLDYLTRRSMISRAEDFIDLAATGSSVTGKPYVVRCGSHAAVPSGEWLRAELERYRSIRERPPAGGIGG
jgi:hypothetical protein